LREGDRAVPVTVQARTPVAPNAGFDIVVPTMRSRTYSSMTDNLIENAPSNSSRYAPAEAGKSLVSTAFKPFHLLISGFGVRVPGGAPSLPDLPI
jgi:hypothetical protein